MEGSEKQELWCLEPLQWECIFLLARIMIIPAHIQRLLLGPKSTEVHRDLKTFVLDIFICQAPFSHVDIWLPLSEKFLVVVYEKL